MDGIPIIARSLGRWIPKNAEETSAFFLFHFRVFELETPFWGWFGMAVYG